MVSTHTVSYGKWCILIDDNLQNFKVRRKHSNCQVLRWLWSPLSGPQRIKRVGGRVGRNPRQGGRLLVEEVETIGIFDNFWTHKLFFRCRLNFTEDDVMWAIGGYFIIQILFERKNCSVEFIQKIIAFYTGLLKTQCYHNKLMFPRSFEDKHNNVWWSWGSRTLPNVQPHEPLVQVGNTYFLYFFMISYLFTSSNAKHTLYTQKK